MADGRLWFNTKIDNSQIEKDLRELKRKIERAQDDITAAEGKKLPLVKSLEDASRKIDAIKRKLKELNADKAVAESIIEKGRSEKRITGEVQQAQANKYEIEGLITEQETKLEELKRTWNSINDEVKKYDQDILKATNDITRATQKTEELNAQLATPNQIKMAQAMEKVDKSASRFNRRLWELGKSALIFNLISSGLRSMVSYMGTALKSNSQYTAQLAQLKGAWLTAFQPIYDFVLPGLLAIMRVLTAIGNALAAVLSFFSGKTATQSAKNAEALNKQASAIGGVGDAAEEASKQLLGFDEINRLESTQTSTGSGGGGGGTSGTIEPDFSGITDMEEQLTQILALVAGIAGFLAAWKIASAFTDDLSKIAGIAMGVGGSFAYAVYWADAFENGIDWENLTGMVVSLTIATIGFGVAFGAVGAGITLLIGSVGLLVLALHEFSKTGEVTDEMLAAIAIGCVGFGAAISLLTGNWIPLLIGLLLGIGSALGITNEDIRAFVSSVLNFFLELWEGIKAIIEEIVNSWNSLWSNNFNYQMTGTIAPASMPATSSRSIPALASGAVLPANKPFLAMVGDQRNGTNIEAPLETIKQALAEVMAQYGGGDIQITFTGELAALGRVLAPVVTKAQQNNSRGKGT